MFGMREAFTVGVVLAAKDMYSGIVGKAQRDIQTLARTSKTEADKFQKSLATWQKVGAIGLGMTVAGATVSRFLEGVAQKGFQLSDALAEVKTVTRGNIGEFANFDTAMEALRTRALELSSKSIFSATSILKEATYELLSSGLNATEAAALLPQITDTAMGTLSSLSAASSAFTTIMLTFGKKWNLTPLEKGKRIADALSQTISLFKYRGDELAATLQYAVAAAEPMNISLEEMLATVGMLKNRGLEASRVGTAYAATLRELYDMQKKLGIPITDSAGRLKSLADILILLKERYGDVLLPAEEYELRTKGLGEEGVRAIKLLWGLGEELKRQTKAVSETGAATRMATDIMSGYGAQMKAAQNRAENLQAELAEKLMPIMVEKQKIINSLISILDKIPFGKTAAGFTLIAAESAKVIGPVTSLIALYKIWQAQTALAAIAQATLNAQLGTTQALAVGVGKASLFKFLFGTAAPAGLASLATAGGILGGLYLMVRMLHKESEAAIQGIIKATEKGWGWAKKTIEKEPIEFKTAEALETHIKELKATIAQLEKELPKVPKVMKTTYEEMLKTAKTKLPVFETEYEARKMLEQKKKIEAVTERVETLSKPITPALPTIRIKKGTPLTETQKALWFKGAKIEEYQKGGYITKPTLALLHPGEMVFPKQNIKTQFIASTSPLPTSPIINISNTFNISSSGSVSFDAKTLARLVIKEMTKALKFDARRYA